MSPDMATALRRDGRIAGALYLVWLTPLFGFGGQSPVFYNLLIAGAALLVLQGRANLAAGLPSRRTALAMLLAGLAITVKTTALFEALYLGIVAAASAWRARRPIAWELARVLRWALLGAAPTLAIAAAYALAGHWPEYWHAMITANLVKGSDWAGTALRGLLIWHLLLPLTLAALAPASPAPQTAAPSASPSPAPLSAGARRDAASAEPEAPSQSRAQPAPEAERRWRRGRVLRRPVQRRRGA